MKKNIIFVIVLILLVGIYFGILVITKSKPILSNEYKVANGTRYDGMLFSRLDCKDGNTKIITRFNKNTCSINRIFENGVYVNDLGVKISEDKFDYFRDVDPMDESDFDIDTINQELYNSHIKFMEDFYKDKVFVMSPTGEYSSEGYPLIYGEFDGINIQKMNDEEKEIAKDRKLYCYYGLDKDKVFVYGDYIDGECIIPDNITDYVPGGNLLDITMKHVNISYEK